MATNDILDSRAVPADHRLSYGSLPLQFGDLRLPKQVATHPVVMMIHGGYWRAKYGLEYTGHICDALAKKGIATWNIEYRRVGDPGGGWPGTAHDVASAYRFLHQNSKKYDLDSTRIVVMGHSAGGHLAFWLAANEPLITRVVSLAGVLDLQQAWSLHLSDDAVVDLLGGTPAQVPEHFKEADPLHLSIKNAAQWVVHGTADADVPISLARTYVAAKHAEKVHFVELAGADHFEIVDPSTNSWKTIEQTLSIALHPDHSNT